MVWEKAFLGSIVSLYLQFSSDPEAAAPEAVEPSPHASDTLPCKGPKAGGVDILVRGRNFNETMPLNIHSGSERTNATLMATNVPQGTLPPSTSAGVVGIGLSSTESGRLITQPGYKLEYPGDLEPNAECCVYVHLVAWAGYYLG